MQKPVLSQPWGPKVQDEGVGGARLPLRVSGRLLPASCSPCALASSSIALTSARISSLCPPRVCG